MDISQFRQSIVVKSKYRYEPLDSQRGEIRLLLLLPSAKEDQRISCNLSVIRLQDVPPYTALSYCWGNSTTRTTIFINGLTFQITSNLASALWYIRKHLASGRLSKDLPRFFWVDAICIDQENVNERSQQVSMMRTLYASAANVFSWLGGGGSSPSTIPSAFEFIRNIVKATQFQTSASMTRRQQLESRSMAESRTTEDCIMLNTIVDPRLIFVLSESKSVIDFFSLEYWHRVWVVQEIVLTRPERNIIIFGDEVVPFHDVQVFRDSWLAFIKELQRNRELELALSEIPGWDFISWTKYLQQMEECLVVWSHYDFMRGLLASEESLFYIILTNAYNASDPRDSVYALLGMISSPRLEPDYMKSVESIYFEWFVTVLKDWQNFNHSTSPGL